MRRLFNRRGVALAAALTIVVSTGQAFAAGEPTWSAAQLSAFSDLVVTGTVETIGSGWDPAVGAIYTYVAVDVDDVLKGPAHDRIVVKQLGGMVNGVGLAVADQAAFTAGEHVLLYLEARPRDGSLYTSALWQGKWTLETGAQGERVAVRRGPADHAFSSVERQSIASVRDTIAAAPARAAASLNVAPSDAEQPLVAAAPFELFGFRFLFVPPVDVQAGGQPGLAAGGLPQLANAVGMWNAAGSGVRLTAGNISAPPRCTNQQLGNGHVTISFMDPCAEMSNTGGTLAIGGAYFFFGGGGTSNGVNFNRGAEGFVVSNDSSTALSFLTNPGCFQDIQTHELGHVLGLNHSSDATAMMFPTIRNNCFSAPHALAPDDINGILFIYGGTPGGTTPPSTPPTNVQVAVNGTASITVSWTAVTALSASAPSAASSYRLDFRQSIGGPVVATVSSASNSITIPLPPGISGTFNVVVTGLNVAGAGPPSSPVTFTIGGTCTGPPPAVPSLTGDVSGSTAFVNWQPAPGATSYAVQAGTTQGSANLFPLTNLGNTLGASAQVPPGFKAFVTVFAVNACGTSGPTTVFIE